jgi:hypothetical protein
MVLAQTDASRHPLAAPDDHDKKVQALQGFIALDFPSSSLFSRIFIGYNFKTHPGSSGSRMKNNFKFHIPTLITFTKK